MITQLRDKNRAHIPCIALRTTSGAKRFISLEVIAISNSAKNGRCYILHDITEFEEGKNTYYSDSIIDHKTGSHNSRYFDQELTACHRTARTSSQQYAIITIDIDKFKHINDTYGHPTADAILKDFALRISKTVRRTDVFARTGGDEFSILMREVFSMNNTERLLKKIDANCVVRSTPRRKT